LKDTNQKGTDKMMDTSKPEKKLAKHVKTTSSDTAANKSMNKSLNTSMARKNYAIDSDDDDLVMNEDSLLKVASISAKNGKEEEHQEDVMEMKKVSSDLSFVLELDDSADKQDLVVPFTTTTSTADKEGKPPKPSKVGTSSIATKTSLKKPPKTTVTHKVFESSENLEEFELDEFDFDEPNNNNNNLNTSMEGSSGGIGSATKKKSKLPPSGLTSLQSSFEF
jgi:hypothetical protein